MDNKNILNEIEPTENDIYTLEETMEFCSDNEKECDTDNCTTEGFYSDDSVKQYLYEIGQIPLLNADEEQNLGQIIKEGTDEARLEAINKLVQANLRLVVHYAKRFLGRGIDFEDLNAMGVEGLFKAAEKFDYTMGFKFSTYASWWINQAISRGIADEGGTVRIPVHMSENIHRVRKAQKVLLQEMGYEPTVEDIAVKSGLSEQTVMSVIRSMYTMVSFETKTSDDGDSTLGEFLADDKTVAPDDLAMTNALKEAVQNVLGQLKPKEAMVLSLRNGIGVDYPLTLDEIAKLPGFGVTRERIRQIELRAMNKIRRSPKMMSMLRDFAA